MSNPPAVDPSEDGAPQGRAAHPTKRLRPPAWLLPVVIALEVALMAVLTEYTYFFQDDFLFASQARDTNLGIGYLRLDLFGHFSPVTRLLDAFVVWIAPGNFLVAHAIQLSLFAAALGAFALTARTLMGAGWGAMALTVLFGQSLFLARLLNWWTASANILPATILGLLMITGYWRWSESGGRRWLLLAIASFALSLLDYETAMYVPVYILLMRLLIAEQGVSLISWARILWREKVAWLAFALLDLAALLNFLTFYYHSIPRPGKGQILHFLEITLFETFIPALLGLKNPEAILGRQAVVVVACLAIAAGVLAASLVLRPNAWRCWFVFVAVFLLNAVTFALNRVALYGVRAGYELYYQQSMHFMCLLLAGMAFSRRWGGVRKTTGAGPVLRRPGHRVAALASGLALLAYGALYIPSQRALADAASLPAAARSYVETFKASLERVRSALHQEPVLLQHPVPAAVVFPQFAPYNFYDKFFALFDPKLRIDELGGSPYVVDGTGLLRAVDFNQMGAADVGRGTAATPDGRQVPLLIDRSGACLPASLRIARIQFPLTTPAVGGSLFLRVHYRMRMGAVAGVLVENSSSTVAAGDDPHYFAEGGGGQWIWVSNSSRVEGVAFDLPGGSCITGVEAGSIRLVTGPS
jgi:hypothetical protein